MIVFDIDGTLSIVGDRLKDLENGDWEKFYDRCGEDKPKIDMICLYRLLKRAGATIVLCTGRRESCREATLKWLKHWGVVINPEHLFMRDDGDRRPDTVVKFEKLKALLPLVTMVFEDRDCMVKAWRDRGITCCQVAEGDF